MLLCGQDDFRLVGSFTDRHVMLFQHAVLLTKKLKDGFQAKAFLNVSIITKHLVLFSVFYLYFFQPVHTKQGN